MSVLIGHASIDERGAAAGGSAGDQTGKEVCKRGWYDKGWNVLLRPANPSLAEKSAQACEAACENSSIGYDQSARNTLYERAKAVSFDLSKIDTPCACDCSSLITSAPSPAARISPMKATAAPREPWSVPS